MISGTTARHFGSLRPFSQSYKTQWVQFTLELELQQDGDTLWKLFNSLTNHALPRRDRPVTSGLAQALLTFLWECRDLNLPCYMILISSPSVLQIPPAELVT